MKLFKLFVLFFILTLNILKAQSISNAKLLLTAIGVGENYETSVDSAKSNLLLNAFNSLASNCKQINRNELKLKIHTESQKMIKTFEIKSYDTFANFKIVSILVGEIDVQGINEVAKTIGLEFNLVENSFAFNIKKKKIIHDNIVNSTLDLTRLLRENLINSLNYELLTKDPHEKNNGKFGIPIEIACKANSQFYRTINSLIKFCEINQIDSAESAKIMETEKLIPTHRMIGIELNKDVKIFTFNNSVIKDIIKRNLASCWHYTLHDFEIDYGTSSFLGNYPYNASTKEEYSMSYDYENIEREISNQYGLNYDKNLNFNIYCLRFNSINSEIANFKLEIELTMEEIEKIKEFNVKKTKNNQFEFKNGGIIVSYPETIYTIGLFYNEETKSIEELVPSKPAASAGLRIGDVILEVNGKKFIEDYQLDEAKKDGKPLKITVDRFGTKIVYTITPNSQKTNGLIMSDFYTKLNYNEAINFVNNFCFQGYSDWRIPTKEELILINQRINVNKFLNLESSRILSSTLSYSDHVYHSKFESDAVIDTGLADGEYEIRLVREIK